MNKRSVRAFSLGLLLATSVLGVTYYLNEKKTVEKNITIEEATNVLKKQNYLVFTKQEYDKVKSELELEVKQQARMKEQQNVATKLPEKTVIAYHLEISSGMAINEIAEKLLRAKIITEKDKFIQYLEENGYSTKIQLGEYKVTDDMSFSQIAKIITKS